MPTDPDVPDRLARALYGLASSVELVLVRRIARALALGIREPTWQARKLSEVTLLREEWERVIADWLVDTLPRSRAAVLHAADVGREGALADLRAATRDVADRSRRPTSARGVIALAEELVGAVASTRLGILRWTEDVYRAVVARTAAQTLLGADTRIGVAQQVLTGLLRHGLTGFVDRSGRRWQLASYVEMATRTATQRAMTQAHTETLIDRGHSLIVVSDAPQECSRCRPWEGQILSLTAPGRREERVPSAVEAGRVVTVRVAGSLDEARAGGLYHPNCRHSHAAYLPGLTRPPRAVTADPEGDKARRRLRELERQVRAAKLAEAAALDDGALRAARARTRELQGKIREHVAATPGLLRQPQREQIGGAR